MNKANHRAFARLETLGRSRDPALVAATKYQGIYKDYLALVLAEGHLIESKNLDRLHDTWAESLEKTLSTVPTTWQGVIALLDICIDNGSIGESLDELKAGVRSISAGVRRLLPAEFKAA